MPKTSEFVEHLMELLKPLGEVKAKTMFGGFGVYKGGLMFGLISEDTFYLKADDRNRSDFESRGLDRFKYKRKGKTLSMSYYQSPEEALEDSEDLCRWARKAYEAALRSAR